MKFVTWYWRLSFHSQLVVGTRVGSDPSRSQDMNPIAAPQMGTAYARPRNQASSQLLGHWQSMVRLKRLTIRIIGEKGTGKKVLSQRLAAISKIMGLKDFLVYISSQNPPKPMISIYLYDITDVKSFEWAQKLMLQANPTEDYVIVGNKIDCEYWRQVTLGKVCTQLETDVVSSKFIEISAQLGLHVELLHDILLRMAFPDLFKLPPRQMIEFREKLETLVKNNLRAGELLEQQQFLDLPIPKLLFLV